MQLLRAERYIADEGLATAIYLALRISVPLLLEGEPGVGKTEVAKALAAATGRRLLRLQCYEGIDSASALYEWDHARQLLHLRAVADAGRQAEDELYSPRYLLRAAASRRSPGRKPGRAAGRRAGPVR